MGLLPRRVTAGEPGALAPGGEVAVAEGKKEMRDGKKGSAEELKGSGVDDG
jgi:hypothetical protein